MIIIPMAGQSSRFFKAGYTIPKYMLDFEGKTIFFHSVSSFANYFKTTPFLFIVRDIYETVEFVKQQVKILGISDYAVIVVNEATRGQAETVALGIEQVDEHESLTIFNIDTFRPGFVFADISNNSDGYLEVFEGEGNNWSFVKPLSDNSTQVIETSEKRPISNLCCTGLYHFSQKNYFDEAFNYYCSLDPSQWDHQELYVAPLYNYLINLGYSIHYHLIPKSDIIFCGTPEEYHAL